MLLSNSQTVLKNNITGGFYLEDNRSKFGTLVLMRNATGISAEENNNLAL